MESDREFFDEIVGIMFKLALSNELEKGMDMKQLECMELAGVIWKEEKYAVLSFVNTPGEMKPIFNVEKRVHEYVLSNLEALTKKMWDAPGTMQLPRYLFQDTPSSHRELRLRSEPQTDLLMEPATQVTKLTPEHNGHG